MRRLLTFLSLALLLTCDKEDSQATNTPPSQIVSQYTLTVSAGDGGSVSTTGGSFASGTQVSITATPNSGYSFSGWSNGSTANPLNVTLNSNTSVTANFEVIVNSYTLTVSAGEGGGVSSSLENGVYEEGTEVTLIANEYGCYSFVGWSGIDSNESSITLTIEANIEVFPIFERGDGFLFRVMSSEGGSVFKVIGEKTLGKHMYGTQYVEYNGEGECHQEGDEIFLYAKADDEYQFYGWEVYDVYNMQDGYTYDMNGGRRFDMGLDFGGDNEVVLKPKFIEHNFWSDPLYSSLNMESTPEDIVRVFLKEATEYGWNFEEKVEEIIINTLPPEGYNASFGWGAGSMAGCKENTYIEINIPIHDGPDSFTRWDFSSRMTVIYHELGHDLMNLKHICLPAHHMSGWDSCPLIEGGNGSRDTSSMFHNGVELSGAAFLLMETEDDVYSFKRATKDMFELNGQEIQCEIE